MKNIQHHFTLLELAQDALIGVSRCQAAGDIWGVEYYSGVYAKILQDLTEPHVKKALEACLKEDNADMYVDANGNLSFTPENE